MNPYEHLILQTALNFLSGFCWVTFVGKTVPKSSFNQPFPMSRVVMLWLTLIVFVSVRSLGDILFSQPAGTFFEAVSLYLYATAFFVGVLIPFRRLTKHNIQ